MEDLISALVVIFILDDGYFGWAVQNCGDLIRKSQPTKLASLLCFRSTRDDLSKKKKNLKLIQGTREVWAGPYFS